MFYSESVCVDGVEIPAGVINTLHGYIDPINQLAERVAQIRETLGSRYVWEILESSFPDNRQSISWYREQIESLYGLLKRIPDETKRAAAKSYINTNLKRFKLTQSELEWWRSRRRKL